MRKIVIRLIVSYLKSRGAGYTMPCFQTPLQLPSHLFGVSVWKSSFLVTLSLRENGVPKSLIISRFLLLFVDSLLCACHPKFRNDKKLFISS